MQSPVPTRTRTTPTAVRAQAVSSATATDCHRWRAFSTSRTLPVPTQEPLKLSAGVRVTDRSPRSPARQRPFADGRQDGEDENEAHSHNHRYQENGQGNPLAYSR